MTFKGWNSPRSFSPCIQIIFVTFRSMMYNSLFAHPKASHTVLSCMSKYAKKKCDTSFFVLQWVNFHTYNLIGQGFSTFFICMPSGNNFCNLRSLDTIICIALCYENHTLELFAYSLGLKYTKLRTPVIGHLT